jgi:hypothetical protein
MYVMLWCHFRRFIITISSFPSLSSHGYTQSIAVIGAEMRFEEVLKTQKPSNFSEADGRQRLDR